MLTLFPEEPILPEGFSYYPDFLTEEEELLLIDAITTVELHTLIFQGFTAKRKVKSFGYDYNFDKRQISEGEAVPTSFSFLLQKVASHLQVPTDRLAEVLVTEYPVGSVINWHRDAPPFDVIVGISLLSSCKFRFRPYNKLEREKGSILSLNVAPRSLYILQGNARSDWEHSIAPVKELRYSITLRTLRNIN